MVVGEDETMVNTVTDAIFSCPVSPVVSSQWRRSARRGPIELHLPNVVGSWCMTRSQVKAMAGAASDKDATVKIGMDKKGRQRVYSRDVKLIGSTE